MALLRVRRHSVSAGTALVVVALFGTVAFASVSRLARQQEAVADANGAIANIDRLLVASAEAERAGTHYLMTGSEQSHASFAGARGDVEDALDALRGRVEDRPRERSILDTLGPVIGERFAALNAGVAVRERKGPEAAAAFAKADTGRASHGGVVRLLQQMRGEELVLLAERTRLMAKNGRVSRMVILGGSVIALILAAFAFAPSGPPRNTGERRAVTTPSGA